MRNLLEPGNRRSNWLEKEESDTSWYEEAIQNYARQFFNPQPIKLFMGADGHAQFMKALEDLKEAPIGLIEPDGKWYDPYPLDSSDLELDEDFDEDPNQPFADESDAEYFRRMDLKRMGQ